MSINIFPLVHCVSFNMHAQPKKTRHVTSFGIACNVIKLFQLPRAAEITES